MNRRQLAEILLTAKKVAGRINSTYEPDRVRLISMGLTEADIEAAEWAVREIERVTEEQLSALDP
jgi:hypothetical protein